MAPPPKAKAPRPPVLGKGLEPRENVSLTTRLALEQCLVDGLAAEGARADRVSLDGVHLVGGSLANTNLTGFTLLDVIGERLDASLAEWPAADLARVELRGCRLTGLKLLEARLESVRFVECQLDYASFVDARFRQVSFESCRLREADFRGADLGGTVFDRCDLASADLAGAKLVGADVTTSEIGEIRVGLGDVRGLIVSRDQTQLFAKLFGLVVRG